jgi:hypothetical protein
MPNKRKVSKKVKPSSPKNEELIVQTPVSKANPYEILEKKHREQKEPGIATITGAGTIKKSE